GFGIDAMLFFQNVLRERGFGISIEDGNDGLENDRAGVEIFVNKMDSATGEFYAVFESLALGFEAGEGREERRMNIKDAIGKFGDEERREQAHISGEADEVDFVIVENGGDLAIVGFALEASRRDH